MFDQRAGGDGVTVLTDEVAHEVVPRILRRVLEFHLGVLLSHRQSQHPKHGDPTRNCLGGGLFPDPQEFACRNRGGAHVNKSVRLVHVDCLFPRSGLSLRLTAQVISRRRPTVEKGGRAVFSCQNSALIGVEESPIGDGPSPVVHRNHGNYGLNWMNARSLQSPTERNDPLPNF
jgi:hypothetical protein